MTPMWIAQWIISTIPCVSGFCPWPRSDAKKAFSRSRGAMIIIQFVGHPFSSFGMKTTRDGLPAEVKLVRQLLRALLGVLQETNNVCKVVPSNFSVRLSVHCPVSRSSFFGSIETSARKSPALAQHNHRLALVSGWLPLMILP